MISGQLEGTLVFVSDVQEVLAQLQRIELLDVRLVELGLPRLHLGRRRLVPLRVDMQ